MVSEGQEKILMRSKRISEKLVALNQYLSMLPLTCVILPKETLTRFARNVYEVTEPELREFYYILSRETSLSRLLSCSPEIYFRLSDIIQHWMDYLKYSLAFVSVTRIKSGKRFLMFRKPTAVLFIKKIT